MSDTQAPPGTGGDSAGARFARTTGLAESVDISGREDVHKLKKGAVGLAGVLFAHYLAYVEPNMFLPQESLYVWLALILGGSGNNRGALLGSLVLLGLLEGSRFAKDVIPFLTGVRLAAAQQILVGVVLVAMVIRRPEGLLPEKPGSE